MDLDIRALLRNAFAGIGASPEQAEEMAESVDLTNIDLTAGQDPAEPFQWQKVNGYDELVYVGPPEDYQRHSLNQTREAGIDAVRILSMRDAHTPPECYDADGTEYDIDKAVRVQPLPHVPADGRECRCVYLPIIRRDDT